MDYDEVIVDYLGALENSDYDKLMDLFSDEAVVNSPLYGEIKASDFYLDLFESTNKSEISLINIFTSITNNNVAAGHFFYEWILKDETQTSFECVDIFKFTKNNKIKELKIIYDTNNTREQFENIE